MNNAAANGGGAQAISIPVFVPGNTPGDVGKGEVQQQMTAPIAAAPMAMPPAGSAAPTTMPPSAAQQQQLMQQQQQQMNLQHANNNVNAIQPGGHHLGKELICNLGHSLQMKSY